MPLDIKNIDKEAGLPEGIHFRNELIWAKMQNRKKTKLIWPWAVAAVVIIGIGLSFLAYQTRRSTQEIRAIGGYKAVIDDQRAPQNSAHTAQTSPIIQENPLLPTPEKKQILEESINKDENFSKIKDSLVPSAQMVNSILIVAEDANFEPFAEEKSLSPAASRLQKSIQKMNPNLTSQQAVVVERFDLIKIIQSQPLQASSNSGVNSGLNSFLHGKIQQN